MFEKLAWELVADTLEILKQWLDTVDPLSSPWSCFLPVLITTQKLIIARVDPTEISLQNGTLNEAGLGEIESVDCLRFQKAIGPASRGLQVPQGLFDVSDIWQRSVMIVNASSFPDWLSTLNLDLGGSPMRETMHRR